MTANPDWTQAIAGLARLSPEARTELARSARVVQLPKGMRPFAPGASCDAYLIVIEGSVRVQLVAENGREIVLYRVERGESCVLTTSCLLSHENYEAEAICETEVTAAALPAGVFKSLLAQSEPFRDFVLASYADRVSDLILTMEETIFQRVDKRLAAVLLNRAEAGRIEATHQTLATELGTAREVVSRQLKVFERRGLVTLQRGSVTLRDTPALQRLVRES